jgi:hypothetical protein
MGLAMWALYMTVGIVSLLAGMPWIAAIWFLGALLWVWID